MNGWQKWARRGVVLLVLVGIGFALKNATKKKPIDVKVVKVERGTVRDVVSSSTAGELMPGQRATLRAELSVRVVKVKHRRGERVKKGELIVLLDTADLEARLEQARASLDAQQGQLAQAKARATSMTKTAARARTLAQSGAGTVQLAEDSESQSAEAQESLKAAMGLLNQAHASLRVAQVARQKAALQAPFDGLLTEVHGDPGNQLVPGAPVFEIIDDSRLYVEANIDEADISKVREKQPATLRFDALAGQEVKGIVSKVAPSVKRDLKGARILPIEVDVSLEDAKKLGLRAGMSANVEIVAAEKDNVLSLPTNVIVGRGLERTVYAIEGGKAVVKKVALGLSNWERSEIVSGLAQNDQVVATLNIKELADGVPVTVGKADSPAAKR